MMELDIPATPSFRLDGKRAIVTGGGRGIGLAMAAALARCGADVVIVARTRDQIEAAAERIRGEGHQAEAKILDVSDLAAVRGFFTAHSAFDVLVNNAGTNRPMPVLDVDEADYDAVMNLNLKSAYFVTQAAARAMVEARIKGSLIHVGSQMGHVGGANRTLYCASKWGLEGMSKALALDLAANGIRSNTIAPTFIETAMTKPFFEDQDFRRSVLEKIKLGRLGRVEDLMGTAIFLASDASALVTGTSIVVDGGWTAG